MQSKPSQDNVLLNTLIILGLIMIAATFFGSKYNIGNKFWYSTRIVQLKFLSIFPDTKYTPKALYTNGLNVLETYTPDIISLQFKKYFDQRYMHKASFVPSVILITCFVLFLIKLNSRSKGSYNMYSFMRAFKSKWPWIGNYIKDDPLNQNPEFGAYAQPLTPAVFLVKNNIYCENTMSFNESLAMNILCKQLGKKLAYPSNSNNKSQAELILHFDETEKKLFEVLARFVADDKIIELWEKHRYKVTFFMGLYECANIVSHTSLCKLPYIRKGLRVLFLALSSVGRKESFVECLGCFSHFQAEKFFFRAGGKGGILEPEVQSGVRSLKGYVFSLEGNEIEHSWP